MLRGYCTVVGGGIGKRMDERTNERMGVAVEEGICGIDGQAGRFWDVALWMKSVHDPQGARVGGG